MANYNFNKVILGGRLTANPELKTTPSGIPAVNRRFGGKNGEESPADFFTVTAWRQTAEFIVKFFRKASSICVVGSIQTKTWEKDGVKHYATEIVADEAYFVDAKNEMPQGASASPAGQPNAAQAGTNIPDAYAAPAAPSEVLGDEEELPF